GRGLVGGGPAPRLGRVVVRLVVAGPARVGPAPPPAVAAVFGGAVHALERVSEGQVQEVVELARCKPQEPPRLEGRELGEARRSEAARRHFEQLEAAPVALLPAHHRPVPLELRAAPAALDARAPRALIQRAELDAV